MKKSLLILKSSASTIGSALYAWAPMAAPCYSTSGLGQSAGPDPTAGMVGSGDAAITDKLARIDKYM